MGTVAYYTFLSLLIFVAVLLILLILIQKGRGGGLSSAFGGGGGSSAFGAKTGDVLTWATSVIFGIFIVLAVALDLVVDGQFKTSAVTASTTPPIAVMPDTTPPVPAPVPVVPSTAIAPPATQPIAASPVTFKNIDQTVNAAATQAITTLKSTTHPSTNP